MGVVACKVVWAKLNNRQSKWQHLTYIQGKYCRIAIDVLYYIMQEQNKWLRLLALAKEYIIPIIVFIIGASITYANLNNRLAVYADSINELEVKQVEMEGVESLILQRLASIDAKLEFIISSIEKIQ